jgi:hypothetical protein
MKAMQTKPPKCENCNKSELDDPKRIALVFSSKAHPGVLLSKDLELPPEFYEEEEMPKLYITISCPTLKCKTTFKFRQLRRLCMS